MLDVLSLGAGVQSSTIALMAAHGEFPPPDCAIFADTGWEPGAVYAWLDWLERQLPFPVYRVSAGNIRADLMRSQVRGTHAEGTRAISPPLYTLSEDGKRGMIRRQCTKEYKLLPLRRKQRELLGVAPRKVAPRDAMRVWIGISTDEASRMKPSRDRWAENRWPLIEKNMSRTDCYVWMERHGYPRPPRSACIGCPFRSDREWRDLSREDFEDACVVDEHIRVSFGRNSKTGNDMRDEVYLHSRRIPLREVDLSTAEDHGQLGLWGQECEGMCGL